MAVNEAGNYIKPKMRKNLFNRIKAGGKVALLGSGQPEKPRCLLVNIRNVVVVIPVEKK